MLKHIVYPAWFKMLVHLYDNKKSENTLTKITVRLNMPANYAFINSVLSNLFDKGMIEKRVDRRNRRQKFIMLTNKGERAGKLCKELKEMLK